ncbi:MAG: TIGR04255 family protein, partial [Planctomycetaceae bacterium]|nr:TIGR04255 family protein [Planctomycetaceae bacterium]
MIVTVESLICGEFAGFSKMGDDGVMQNFFALWHRPKRTFILERTYCPTEAHRWPLVMDRRRYKNPPIEEAVCDFQFAPGTDWDPTMPGLLYEKLRDTYNEKPRQQQLIEAQVQGVNSEGSPSVSFQHRFGKTRVQ